MLTMDEVGGGGGGGGRGRESVRPDPLITVNDLV